MAQTLVVLTSGIDLSVGMVMVLANCLASAHRRRLAARRRRSACSRCSASAASCGAINGADRDLRPAAADRHDDRHRRRLLRRRAGAAPRARRRRQRLAGRRADRPAARRQRAGEPGAAARGWCSSSGCRSGARRSAAPPTRSARPSSRPTCRACRSAAPSSSPTCSSRPARLDRRAVPHLHHLLGRGVGRQRQHLHALFDRRRRARRRVAVRRLGQRDRRDLRRA